MKEQNYQNYHLHNKISCPREIYTVTVNLQHYTMFIFYILIVILLTRAGTNPTNQKSLELIQPFLEL